MSIPLPALRTPLCDLLGVRVPIIKAPMAGGIDTPELVAAVSAAGGLGLLAAADLSPEELRTTIRRIKTLTDRPFGVNLVVDPIEALAVDVAAGSGGPDRGQAELGVPSSGAATPGAPPVAEQLAVALAEAVPVLNTMGDPTTLIAPAHAGGALVLAAVTTIEEARQVAAAGADGVVAQGAEAGGRRGSFRLDGDGEAPLVGTLALVPQVVDAVPWGTPVVAAGGIMDGRGVAAALALGAAGVLMGTRFCAARESGIGPAWRVRLQSATEVDTVVSHAPLGWPARSLRLLERDAGYLPAGQGLGMLTSGDGAARIVAELVAEARARLAQLGTLAGKTGANADAVSSHRS